MSDQQVWSKPEIALLRVIFPLLGAPDCVAWFPRWQQPQISSKASALKIHVHPVVKKQNHIIAMNKRCHPKRTIVDDAIQENPDRTDLYVADLTGTDVIYVRKRGVALGIKLEVEKPEPESESVEKTAREVFEEGNNAIERLAACSPWRTNYPRELREPWPA